MSTMTIARLRAGRGYSPTVRNIADEAQERAGEFEAPRRALDSVSKLKRVDGIKMLDPIDVRGLDPSLTQWIETMMELAGADDFTGCAALHVSICGASGDQARFKVVDNADGLGVTESRSLESGCIVATFVAGLVILPGSADEPPRLLAALARMEVATIEEVRDPVGLADTGGRLAHHVSASDAPYEVTGRVHCGTDPASFRL